MLSTKVHNSVIFFPFHFYRLISRNYILSSDFITIIVYPLYSERDVCHRLADKYYPVSYFVFRIRIGRMFVKLSTLQRLLLIFSLYRGYYESSDIFNSVYLLINAHDPITIVTQFFPCYNKIIIYLRNEPNFLLSVPFVPPTI